MSLPTRPAVPRPATRKKPSTADVRPETLAQFDAEVRQQIGIDDFAATVQALWVARQRIAALERARKEAYEQVKVAYDSGTRLAAGWEIRVSRGGQPEVYRAVDSAEVKKRAPAAYAAARTLVRRVSVTAPKGAEPPLPKDRVPRLPKVVTAEAAMRAYKSEDFGLLKQLRDDETDLVGRLEKIAADAGWDGEEIVFADGWKAATHRRQFSGERLREIDPDTWNKLAVTKVRENRPRVYVAKPGADDDGAVDLDGE